MTRPSPTTDTPIHDPAADPIGEALAALRTEQAWRRLFALASRHGGRSPRALLLIHHRFTAHAAADQTGPHPVPVAELAQLLAEQLPALPQAGQIRAAFEDAARTYQPPATSPPPRPRVRRPRRRPRPTLDHDPARLRVPTTRGTLTATASLDLDQGRIRYHVERVGVFILGPNEHDYGRDYKRDSVRVQYGDDAEPGDWEANGGYLPRPAAPVINGITLVGYAVVTPGHIDPRRGINAPRPSGRLTTRSAPDATCRRAAEIVTILADHYHAHPDRAAITRAHDRHHAPHRLAEHQREINTLRERIAELSQQLATAEAAAALQRALLRDHVDHDHAGHDQTAA